MFPQSEEHSSGTDPETRRELLQDALADVAYRRELLDGLEAVRAKWDAEKRRKS
jgi:hypothetical protein